MADSRKPFVAVYDGSCNDCGDDIYGGDMIAYVDDEVVCERCWETAVGEPDD